MERQGVLKAAYEKGLGSEGGRDVMPMTQDGDTFFLDKSLIPEGKKCKPGDEVTLKARVESLGSKLALTPIEILDTTYGDDMDETPKV